MRNKLTFINISEANVDSFAIKIVEFHNISPRKRYDPNYWYWRYFKSPAGKGSLIIALRGSRVVGKYGLVYLQLTVNGETVLAGLMEGLLICPRERFWQCYRGLVERCNLEKQGVNLAFSCGIAHCRSLELFKRLGVADLGRIPVYLGFLDIARTLEGFRVPYPLSLLGYLGQAIIGLRAGKNKMPHLSIRHVKSFDSSFDELWDNVAKKHVISVTRNAGYLNWRYAESPAEEYKSLAAYSDKKLEGLVVFCVRGVRNGSYILELFARDDNKSVMRELLLRAFKELKAKNIGCITASFPAASNAASALRGLGFKPWGTRLWSTHMIVSAGSQKSFSIEQEFKNWNFSLGDWLVH